MVGRDIVRHCLEDSRITKVFILTRKAVSMDVESHPKADIIMHQDFSRYSDDLLTRLEGSCACLWAIGGRPDQLKEKSLLQQINVDLPLAAARIMSDRLADKAPGGARSEGFSSRFTFVYCSNKNTERHSSPLSFLGDSRKHRNEAEKGLFDIYDSNSSFFNICILRPNSILLPDAPKKKKKLIGSRSSNGVDASHLAKVFVKVALEGSRDQILENDVLLKL